MKKGIGRRIWIVGVSVLFFCGLVVWLFFSPRGVEEEVLVDTTGASQAPSPDFSLRGFQELKRETGVEERERLDGETAKKLIYGLVYSWMGFLFIFGILYYLLYIPASRPMTDDLPVRRSPGVVIPKREIEWDFERSDNDLD